MEWISKINRIVCLNLSHREDRLIAFTEMCEKYQIPFDRIEAIYDTENGARGLRDTMVKLFSEEVAKNTQSILVFEDDAEIKVNEETFHDTMNKVVRQLPDGWQMVFLGCQLTSNGCRWQSANLIEVIKAFSTHACLYSLQGMNDILSMGLDFPIDNSMVDKLQPHKRSYCTYPLLCSQRPGVSDIYRDKFTDWRPFIDQRFEQRVNQIRR